MSFEKSKQLYQKALDSLAGGISAGQRYVGVLGHPVYMDRAEGCRLYDIDGNEYIDFHTGAGAALFGYNHPRLKKAAEKAIDMTFFMNFETEYHIELSKLIQKFFPSAERVRLSNTGTEATQGAMRIARAYTGRDIIVRFDGHFHGMNEMIWYNHVKLGEMDEYGQVELVPDSQGFPSNKNEAIKVVNFNDVEAFKYVCEKYKGRIAGAIMEPVSFNCGSLLANKQYLEKIREICTREDIVLIFDEVITGLRMRPGSAQLYFGVTPDVTCMAKGIAGGFPISAIGGKKEIMDVLAPIGKTVMSGTYTGSLMPVLASIECFKIAKEPEFYDQIDAVGSKLYSGITELMKQYGIPGFCHGLGARFSTYFGVEDEDALYSFRKTAEQFDHKLFKRCVAESLKNGLFFHDTATSISPAHRGITAQHTLEDIDEALNRIEKVFSTVSKEL